MQSVNMDQFSFKDIVMKGQFEIYEHTLPAENLA